MYAWGSNGAGQLGYGTYDSATQATPRVVEALKGKRVRAVAAAKKHTLALAGSSDVWWTRVQL